jgi:Flp pilus assembly protein TadG
MSAFWKVPGKFSAFASDRRGNIAVIYALALVPLLIAGGAALDYARAVIVRSSLAEALDAAGLAVGGSPNMAVSDEIALAQTYFNANYTVDSSYGTPSAVTLVQSGQDFLLSSNVTVPTILLRIAGIDNLPVSYSITVSRNSKNIEVALALDITGSMAGQRIADLKTAAADLIDLVVQDVQSPTYSKVAIAPYTMGVNVGSYATQVRGAIAAGKTITAATKAYPVVVTSANHGFSNGDYVYIDGVSGMTQLNGKAYVVASRTTDTFALQNVDGRAYYSYASGGAAYCTTAGCQYYRFTNASGGVNVYPASTCATERTASAYSDTAPSLTPLGRNYASTTNPCPSAAIMPLSTDRTSLKNAVDNLSASGSTAGHIGVAWAWYLLSPNFGYLWPSGSQPAAYTDPNLMKFAVLMTDGAFNTPYCNGVISKDAASGSGSASEHINCNAPNGSSLSQAKQICSAMKAQGIAIYAVGFDVGADQNAIDFINSCATDSAHAYFPATGADLKSAFHDIAQQITNLRVKT